MKRSTFLLLFIGLTNFTMAQSTFIVAHRGFSSIAPENSLSAFEAAIECGAPYFELDVQASADGVPMVIHDETLDRTSSSGHTGRVDHLAQSELRQVHVGYASKFGAEFALEPLPTLADALALAKGRIKVCVEVKVSGIEEAIVRDIQEQGMASEVVVFSFLPNVLSRIHELAPELPLLFLKEHATADDLKVCKALKATAIGVGGQTILDAAFVEAAAAANIQIWRWTVDASDEMRAMLNIPVQGLISNRPDEALRQLNAYE
jgi:glycerophosphoryl diester phosphodiesterase